MVHDDAKDKCTSPVEDNKTPWSSLLWPTSGADPDTGKPRLRVGLLGGDVPVHPPYACAVFSGLSLLGGYYVTGGDMRPYLPASPSALVTPLLTLSSVEVTPILVGRIAVAASISQWAKRTKERAKRALLESGTTPAFQHSPRVVDGGVFATSRNPMYLALLALPLAGSLALDTSWLLYATAALALYLDRIVVPAEERHLRTTLGKPYDDYCARVPRWFSLI